MKTKSKLKQQSLNTQIKQLGSATRECLSLVQQAPKGCVSG